MGKWIKLFNIHAQHDHEFPRGAAVVGAGTGSIYLCSCGLEATLVSDLTGRHWESAEGTHTAMSTEKPVVPRRSEGRVSVPQLPGPDSMGYDPMEGMDS